MKKAAISMSLALAALGCGDDSNGGGTPAFAKPRWMASTATTMATASGVAHGHGVMSTSPEGSWVHAAARGRAVTPTQTPTVTATTTR